MNVLYSARQRQLDWRIHIAEYQGVERLSVWPFSEKNGEWFPRAAKIGGGFQFPLNRLPELVEALQSALPAGGAE